MTAKDFAQFCHHFCQMPESQRPTEEVFAIMLEGVLDTEREICAEIAENFNTPGCDQIAREIRDLTYKQKTIEGEKYERARKAFRKQETT